MKNKRLISIVICLATITTFAIGCRTEQPEAHAAKTSYNVRKFGATGDGKILDSPAINKAIDAAEAAGGGTVLIPAGTYLCGSIHLQSNIHLVIDAGATILAAPQNMKAYDAEEDFKGPAFQDGGHTYFHNSLIWGENLTNVFITGNGMINGTALTTGDGIEDHMDGFSNFGKAKPTAYTPPPNAWPQHLGNKAIALKLCKNVLIRDITIFKGGHFAILVTGCTDMTIDNVTVDTDRDGMDIDCCCNTMVSNCRINSPNDDGLCPKSTYALGHPVIEDNLTIVNCQVSGFQVGTLLDGTMKPSKNENGRIKFGTESSGGFRNCTIANCTFRDCRGLALEEVDGGIMENITINNISMMDVPHYGIYITTGKRDRTPNLTTNSTMKNIFISNVIADNVGSPSGIQITGMPGAPIENLRLDNIRLNSEGGGTAAQADNVPKELGKGYPEPGGVMPAYGVFARHVKNLELANISTSFEKTDMRPAIVCSDINGLEIDNFKPEVAEDVTPAEFHNVSGLVIHDSPALESKGN
ncbi:MAG TPA: glycoside hydrolase family 28 protein [Candidatus Aquilonibacter sp.]|nr:glycoside hydrolase family 28 protein [Candidatus Aquilonibacter sp.]